MSDPRVQDWIRVLSQPPSSRPYFREAERQELADILRRLSGAVPASEVHRDGSPPRQPFEKSIFSPINSSLTDALVKLEKLALSPELREDFELLMKENVHDELREFIVFMTLAISELNALLPATVFALSETQVKLVYDSRKIYILADTEEIIVSISIKRQDTFKFDESGMGSALIHTVGAMAVGADGYVPKTKAVRHFEDIPNFETLHIKEADNSASLQFSTDEELREAVLRHYKIQQETIVLKVK